MNERIDRMTVWGGWLFFIVASCRMASLYGDRWVFGRYFMPVTAFSADGTRYADGTTIDPLSMQLGKSAFEAEIMLLVAVTMLTLLAFAWYLCWDSARKRRMILRSQLELEWLCRQAGTRDRTKK